MIMAFFNAPALYNPPGLFYIDVQIILLFPFSTRQPVWSNVLMANCLQEFAFHKFLNPCKKWFFT